MEEASHRQFMNGDEIAKLNNGKIRCLVAIELSPFLDRYSIYAAIDMIYF
jgi:hypothetical protein